jgi:5-methylcytosine-specific restriction endonuclease McrBC regulatory subunit McrC
MKPIEARDCLPFDSWKDWKELDKRKADEAIRKLCEYFENTNEVSKDDDDKIVSLQTVRFRYDNDEQATVQTRWWAGRYIGLAKISINTSFQTEISIRPRFGEKFLLTILEDLYNIRVGSHDSIVNKSSESEWFGSLLNILRRRIWVDKCAKANRYGLPRKNVKRDYQGVALRGALDIRRTIMPWLTQKEVSTNIYEKTFDDNICRIVYEAHRILSKNVIENKVGRRTNQDRQSSNSTLGFSMPPTVQDTINALNSQYKGKTFNLTEVEYKRIRYNSIYVSWKPLVDFSWDVIRNTHLGYKSSDNQTQCIFIDMAEIWEAFLRKKLGEGFANDGWRVLSVEECRYRIYKGKFYSRDIIPDIILTRQNGQGENEYMVFDAKYKRMRANASKGYDVDRSDFFQIHTYINYVEHHLGHVVIGGLLYPLTKKVQTEDGSEIEINIDENKFHSEHLYGLEERNKSNDTKFIIDGVYCPESDNAEAKVYDVIKDDMEENVKAMIKRIKKAANF